MPFLIVEENAARIHAEAAPEFDEICREMGGIFRKKRYLYNKYMEYLRQAASARPETEALRIYPRDSYGQTGRKAYRAAMAAVRDFLSEYDRMVYIVLEDKKGASVSLKHSGAVARYLDRHYIPLLPDRYDECKNYRSFPAGGYEESKIRYGAVPMAAPAPASAARSLDDLMEHMSETFSQMLLRLIDERGVKDPDVYRKANIDRRHFSKIRKDKDYTPNKKTVLAFAIALELSLDETKDLLMRAGFALSNSSRADVIIRYFIEEQNYDIFEINETLFAYGQPLLG